MPDLSYLAGLFDGEGHIAWQSAGKNKRKRLTLQVRMTEERLVRFYAEAFGGAVYYEASKNPKHRDTWFWRATDVNARCAYEAMKPYLILKQLPDQERLSCNRKELVACNP